MCSTTKWRLRSPTWSAGRPTGPGQTAITGSMPVDTVRCAPRNKRGGAPGCEEPRLCPVRGVFCALGTGRSEDTDPSAAVGQSAVWCNRGGPISAEPRINDRIRVPEVRLVGPSGEQVGIVPLAKALELAQEYDLDLVEVAATARPPVCKLMDYGKFKYENAQKAREARRNPTNVIIKAMKLRPKIDSHDYETKKGHVVRFLKAGDKVVLPG